ncbi:MAG: amidohydrolase family protein [Dehalococcoidia bacterium]
MKALDSHIHFSTKQGYLVRDPKMIEAMEKYYRMKVVYKSDEEMAQDFINLDIKAVLLPIDCETATGWPTCGNDYAASMVKRFPQAFAGSFAAIDPWKGEKAIQELDRAVKQLGMIGVKFQQALQAFFPNDRRFYPIYEKCVELKVPVLFHMGTTGAGAGMPGGGGIRLKYTQPIPYIDDVAADFPDLTIIGAHPAWPWQEEMIAVLLHKPNVYNDLSGWSPKYFSDSLKREIGGRLQDKMFYGSDYPEIQPQRWLSDFEALEYSPEVMEKVLYKNAIRVLNLKV